MTSLIPAERMLSLVLDALPARVFWKDRDSRILGCNQSFADDAGVDRPADLIGRTNFDAYPSEQAAAFRADDLEVMSSGRAKLGIEERLTLASGEVSWVETNKIPFRDSAGEIIGILATYHDITPRRRAAEERAQLIAELTKARDAAIAALPAELMLSAVLDAMPVRIFWKDLSSRFLGCNQGFADEVGLADPEGVIGKTDFDFCPRAQAEVFQAEDALVMRTGVPQIAVEQGAALGSGEMLWVESNKFPLRNSKNKVIGVLCTYVDISARRRAREERAQMIEEITTVRDAAISASAAKSDFVSSMSHELRTPLNTIIGYAELMQEEATSDGAPANEDLGKIQRAAHHLLGLVNDILDLAKISAGSMSVQHDVLSPATLVGEVIDALGQLAAQDHTQLRWASPPAPFVTVCDETKLRQCVFNLVSNACKFAKGGIVEISLTADDSAADPAFVIEVRDTGIGISAEQIDRLFQPFAQANESISRTYGGTGLGLTITRSLAQVMGGEVSARSTLGVGSTFTLRLPRPAIAAANTTAARVA